MKKWLIPVLILFSFNIFGQVKYSSFEIKENLSRIDPIDPQIGRYDAYELKVNAGDEVVFRLTSSDFWPYLLLVSPSGKSQFHIPPNKEFNLVKKINIDETGDWDFYICGDSSLVGKYKCSVAFSNGKVSLPNEGSLCEITNFIFNNAEANFLFLLADTLDLPFNYELIENENILKVKLRASDYNFTDEEIADSFMNCVNKNFMFDYDLKNVFKKYNISSGLIENRFKDQKFILFEKIKNNIATIYFGVRK